MKCTNFMYTAREQNEDKRSSIYAETLVWHFSKLFSIACFTICQVKKASFVLNECELKICKIYIDLL